MPPEVFMEEVLIFAGLMATLGALTKVTLAIINRRKVAAPAPDVTAALQEISERLTRLEQTADSTALEVERISEGQRFTTKLLAGRGERQVVG